MAKPKLNLASFTGVVSAASGTAARPDAEVDLRLIDTKAQVRTQLGDLQELAGAIAAQGVLQPILLLAKDDGRYLLIAGERRVRASMLAGKSTIPAVIKRGLSDLQFRAMQVAENNERKNLSAFEEAMGVIEDVEKFGFDQAKNIWNRSEGWVSKRLAVAKFAEPVRVLLENGLCGDLEVLNTLQQIYKIEEIQFFRFAEKLQSGVTVSRDETRSALARAKAWHEQQGMMAERHQQLNKPSKQSREKPPQSKELGASVKNKVSPKEVESRGELKQAATDQVAAKRLKELRASLYGHGLVNRGKIGELKVGAESVAPDMGTAQWVVWQAFVSVVAPALEGIGDRDAAQLLKKLLDELKTKSAKQVWEEVHAGQGGTPEKPEGWFF